MSTRSAIFRASVIAAAVVIGVESPLARGAVSEVSGRVLKPDGQPASGATVYVYRNSYADWSKTGIRAQTVADSQGRFEVGRLLYDREQRLHDRLVAIHEGFGLAYWSTRDDLVPTCRVDLRLTPEAALTGSVKDGSGQTLENARIVLTSIRFRHHPSAQMASFGQNPRAPLPPLAASSDARGRFALRGLPKTPDANLTLRVMHSAFATASRRGTLRQVAQRLDITLTPGSTMEGTVTHESVGRPAPGIQVLAVRRVRGWRLYERATTDERGRYRIGNLPAGRYTVRVIIPDNAEWTAAVRPNVTLLPDQVAQTDLTLIEGLSMRGRVVEAGTDTPVAGAALSARGPEQSIKGTSKADGSFRLRCPPGVYRVRVSSVPESYVRPDWRISKTVRLTEGADRPALELAVAKGVIVEGRAVDRQGQPVAGIRVGTRALMPMPSLATAHTNGEGAFRLTGIMPDARLALRARDTETKRGGSTMVQTEGADLNGVVLRLHPLAKVTGRVVDSSQAPVSGVEVTLYETCGETSRRAQTIRTEADGSFELLATPGMPFTVRAPKGRRDSLWRRIVAEAGGHHEWGDIVVPRLTNAPVRGRVETADGKPVPHAQVTMWVELGHDTAVCNSQGEFRFSRRFATGRKARLSAKNPQGLLAGQATFTTSPSMSPLTVRLKEAGLLTGRVVDDQSRPILDAKVSLGIRHDRGAMYLGDAVYTDEHGRFRYAGLVPGQQGEVRVEAPDYGTTTGKGLCFESGSRTDTGDLVLLRADSFVAGKVTNADGKPLAGVAVSCSGRGAGSKTSLTDVQGRYRIDGIPDTDGLQVRAISRDYGRDRRRQVKAGSTDVDLILVKKHRAARIRRSLVGLPAPELTIATWLNTQPLELKGLRGKVVLLHFWTMYSRPCIRGLKRIKPLQEQFPKRLAIIAVHDRAAPADEVKQFIKDNGVTFAVAIGKSGERDGWTGETFRNYRVESLPATFLIDKSGILRQTNVSDDLAAQVKALIEE